jgi:Tfp pilus assembly protein PilX
MHMIRLRAAAAQERGFTLIVVLAIMTALMLLTVAAYGAAGGDVHLGRNDTDQKIAYAAAEAGIQDYLFHLNQDNG